MTTYVPMFVSLFIWIALWLYILSLDRKVRKLSRNV